MARRRITYEELAARYEAWRAKTAAYRAAYYARPEVKAKRVAYQARPEVKAKRVAYRARPEVKAKRVAYWANLRRLATLAKEAGLG